MLRASDTIGRPGGDEFAILAEGLSLSAGPELLAERLLDALKEPFRVEGFDDIPLSITASIGIATNDGDEPDDLLRDAAIALCQAKARGRNCHVQFKPEMKTAAMERLELEADLREALQENQFFILYQPIFELDSVGVCGVEALLRWRHPVRGIVDPESFMPVLEETGMIIPGRVVAAQASLPTSRRVASARPSPDDVDQRLDASARGGGPRRPGAGGPRGYGARAQIARHQCRRAELDERTWTPWFVDFASSRRSACSSPSTTWAPATQRSPIFARFRSTPSRLTGRSSPRWRTRPKRSAPSTPLCSLGRTLGIETLAEGIEQGWQLASLQNEHCRFGQGSLFSQPIAPEALEAILTLEPVVPLRGHLPRQSRPASTIRRRNC